MTTDWARPVVHFEIVARDPERQRAFYQALCHWDIGDGPLMQIPAGLGGPEPGPAGHLRQGEHSAVNLYIQVRVLADSLALARELGAEIVMQPFDVPDGPTLAVIKDPEGLGVVLVQQ
jgi:predicted enzyme related to lactoylglutathione lyase